MLILGMEFAARGGGVVGDATTYAGSDDLDEVGWYRKNSAVVGSSNFSSSRGANEVGIKQANELGIYDMSGNVWKWTSSRFTRSDFFLINRGGSWDFYANYCSVSYKFIYTQSYLNAFIGFRPTRSI